MSRKIVFAADFYKEQFLGGAELNDDVLLQKLEQRGYTIEKKSCSQLTVEYLSSLKKETPIIIGNFVTLSEEAKSYMMNNVTYIIYEHDHKYDKKRDPSRFANFKIPEREVINRDFYRNAKKIVALTKLAKEVMEKNLGLENIVSIGTSMFSDESLDHMKSLQQTKKEYEHVVVKNKNIMKGTQQALDWCSKNNIEPTLISSSDYKEFLSLLAKSKTLVFVPRLLETFCRLIAEAKALNCKVITKEKIVGFASEQSFSMTGEELIEELRDRTNKAIDLFEQILQEKKTQQEEEFKVSAVLLVWKRVESTSILVEQVSKIKQIDEIILWNNNPDVQYTKEMFDVDNITIVNSHINKITFGRYLGASLAKNEYIFVQDDDWNIIDFEKIYDNIKKSFSDIVSVCPNTHMQDIPRNKFVGWGSIFRKKCLDVFSKYIERYGEDNILYREADLLFTNCNKYEKMLTKPSLLIRDDNRSLSLKPEHFNFHYEMLKRVKEVYHV